MKRFNILHFLTMLMVMTFAFSSCSKDDETENGIHTGKTPDGLEAVDLGLPSGTLWANMNVGATKPEEYGGYYAWGETVEKNYYTEDNYAYFEDGKDGKDGKYVNIGDDIAGTEYDVAHVKWSGNWRMPTQAQIKELLKYTTWTWEQINGVRGMRFTATNGNSIFLPAAGRWDDNLNWAGDYGYYWSSTQGPDYDYGAYALSFYSGSAGWYGNFGRDYGRSVRPVY